MLFKIAFSAILKKQKMLFNIAVLDQKIFSKHSNDILASRCDGFFLCLTNFFMLLKKKLYFICATLVFYNGKL